MSSQSSAREPWVDALRVLAVLGVFIVNGLGYTFAPTYPLQLGPPQPIDSPSAIIVHSVMVGFVQGKAWPILSFLFGYSLCSIAMNARRKGLNATALVRKRSLKLLLIGVIHGCVLYFGDILTTYAICGLLVAPWLLYKTAGLVKIWQRITTLVVIISTIYLGLVLVLLLPMGNDVASNALAESSTRFGSVQQLSQFFILNSNTYASSQLEALIGFLPLVMWLGIAGVFARRFKLLSLHQCSRAFWATHMGNMQCSLAIACNMLLALANGMLHNSLGYSDRASAIALLSGITGIWMSAALLALAMRAIHRRGDIPNWVLWLAHAGRHTLCMYLSLSAALVLSNPVFLNLKGGTLTTFAALVLAWLLAVVLARQASANGLRDPIARWLSR